MSDGMIVDGLSSFHRDAIFAHTLEWRDEFGLEHILLGKCRLIATDLLVNDICIPLELVVVALLDKLWKNVELSRSQWLTVACR